jgi:hypothetical protein
MQINGVRAGALVLGLIAAVCLITSSDAATSFEDDFNDGIIDARWGIVQAASMNVFESGGALNMSGVATEEFWETWGSAHLLVGLSTPLTVESRFSVSGSGTGYGGYMGLIDQSGGNYVTLGRTVDPTIEGFHLRAGIGGLITDYVLGVADAAYHTYKLTYDGDYLTAYIDGLPRMTIGVTFDAYGVYFHANARAIGDTVSAQFDHFQVDGTMCIPLIEKGGPDGKIGVVFVADQNSYGTDWGAFTSDALGMIQQNYYGVPEIAAGSEKMNFYYVRRTGSVTVDQDGDCHWSFPSGSTSSDYVKEACPDADMAVILHTSSCVDYAKRKQGRCSAELGEVGILTHETGHALFKLGDGYDAAPQECGTHYEAAEPYPNIYDTQIQCEQESVIPGPGVCGTSPFTSCQGDWWKADPDDIMQSLEAGFFGPDADRRISYVFSQYSDPPPDDSTKAVLLSIRVSDAGAGSLAADVVYGYAPEHVGDWQDLMLRLLSPSGMQLDQYGLGDPRYREYEDLTFVIEAEADFTVAVPFHTNLRFADLRQYGTGELLVTVDLGPSVVSFCESNNYQDPDCQLTELDDDGVVGPADNCPLVANPDQADTNANGVGDACESAPVGGIALLPDGGVPGASGFNHLAVAAPAAAALLALTASAWYARRRLLR